MKIKRFNENNWKPTNKFFHDIDKILNSYLNTALWCEETEEYEDKSINDFSEDAVNKAKEEISWFVDSSGNILDYYNDNFIGSNIWYEREGHGVGFWDKDDFSDEEKEILGALADAIGRADMYVSDDGQIEFGSTIKYKDFNLQKFHEEQKLKKDIKKYNL